MLRYALLACLLATPAAAAPLVDLLSNKLGGGCGAPELDLAYLPGPRPVRVFLPTEHLVCEVRDHGRQVSCREWH